ncbi:MAG: DUF2652 domain-containing protein [Anaerolineae bacterium]|nr:MAG: DUF2652 domain-containing protein [Anaerolineae bacterium]
MQEQSGALLMADISGYTRFSRMHATSLLHAEEIISELLEAVIAAAEFPLQVSQLEGDAVLLTAVAQPGREAQVCMDVAQQVNALFQSFNAQEQALIACDAGCACDACNTIGGLRLKAALHFGKFSRQEIGSLQQITGESVEILRALIKSPANADEFAVLTERFHSLSGGLAGRSPDGQMTVSVSGQEMHAQVYYLQPALIAVAPPAGAGPAFSRRLNRHAYRRMMGKRPRSQFSHLQRGDVSFIRYLLEGVQSGWKVMSQLVRRLSRFGQIKVQVRPVALLLLEVSSAPVDPAGKTGALHRCLRAAQAPLVVNKLESDAVLFYAIAERDPAETAAAMLGQIPILYQASKAVQFKAILHFGQAAFKSISRFEEMGGEDVILAHRLLRNSIAEPRYLLLTNEFKNLVTTADTPGTEERVQSVEGFGDMRVWVSQLD